MKSALALALLLSLTGCAAAQQAPDIAFDKVRLTEVAPDASGEDPQTPRFVLDSVAKIEIDDQSGDGQKIRIEEIRVGRDNSLLVIYDNSGRVLGSVALSPQSQPVVMVLDFPVRVSQELEAVIYLDDGDGVFDSGSDLPLIDEGGELVQEDFRYRVESDE